ncbi:hypothetical protein [Deinococcus piscis]|nr:hypothetical protein [Deinococcus piscis]
MPRPPLSHRPTLVLPALLAGCFSPGNVAAQCEAAARRQLADLNPPAQLREFQQLQSEAHTERSGGQTLKLGLSEGALSAEQAGEMRSWPYTCRVHGDEVSFQLAPDGQGPQPTPSQDTPPAFDLGGEGEVNL